MSVKRRSRGFVSAWLQKKLIPAELQAPKPRTTQAIVVKREHIEAGGQAEVVVPLRSEAATQRAEHGPGAL